MEPPPSTYAAQIVNNIESAKNQAPHASARTNIRELLSMILRADRHAASLDGALDQSLEVNQKLIIVIIYACLLSQSAVDPFRDSNEARELQIDCLAVVELTVRRRPEVLLSCPSNHVAAVNPNTPLFLWLIPHLVNCFLADHGQEVYAGVRQALATIFSVQGGSTKFRLSLNPVLKYGYGCVNGKHPPPHRALWEGHNLEL